MKGLSRIKRVREVRTKGKNLELIDETLTGYFRDKCHLEES